MDHKKKLIEKVESFYIDIIEEFKETELQIIADSGFKSIFRKKDYDGNISRLKYCKKQALAMDTEGKSIPADDMESRLILKNLEKCLALFNTLCDSYIRLQTSLKKKAAKEPLKYSEYREIFNKVQESKDALNKALHQLDIVYTDYTYDEDEPYEFMERS